MTTERDHDELIEGVASAWRPRDAQGQLQSHPAWHDLDEAGRLEAFETAVQERKLEAALDDDGLSATGRAVISRISARQALEPW